eukprot:gene3720-6608_t
MSSEDEQLPKFIADASANCFNTTSKLLDCVQKKGKFSQCKEIATEQMSCFKKFLKPKIKPEILDDLDNFYQTQYDMIDREFDNPNSKFTSMKPCFKPSSVVSLCDSNNWWTSEKMQPTCVSSLKDLTICSLKQTSQKYEKFEKCWKDTFDEKEFYPFDKLEKSIQHCFDNRE